MMKKRFAAWLAACSLIVGSVMPVSAEEQAGASGETDKEASVETSIEAEQDPSAESEQNVFTETEQDEVVEDDAGSEESGNNDGQKVINTELTDSTYVEGGNAEDSAAGIQPFAAGVYEGLFNMQLDGLSLEIYEQIAPVFLNYADPVTFEPDAEEYGLEFEVPAGDSAAVEQQKETIAEMMDYAMSSALAAYQMDVPLAFWLRGLEGSWSFSIETSGSTSHWKVTEIMITPVLYYDNADADIQKFKKGFYEAVDVLSAQMEVSDTWYEKAKKIHDWINEQVTYNYDAANIGGDEYMYAHTPYPVFADDKGKAVVCEGYAKAFQLLCEEFLMACESVSGMAYTSSGAGPHMWNIVSMPDGNYYAVDLTWDDSGDAGDDTYFMVGANTQGFYATFAQEHVMNTQPVEGGMNFVFPSLAEEAYVPDERYYGSGEYDEEQGTYTITYNPAETVNIPWKVFEEVLGGDVANKITIDIPELDMSLEGSYWRANYQVDIPYDVDVKKGIYDATVILEQTSPGYERQWSDTTILKIKVEEDMQGIHYINSVAETDGTRDAVFKFKNGTGANRITSINCVDFVIKNGPNEGSEYWSFSMPGEGLEYDLDEGTVTIPKEWIGSVYEEYGMSFVPYVYHGQMVFTLANGETIYSDLSNIPEPVPIDEFENPGDDGWYFIYREPGGEEPDVLPGDINLDEVVNSGDLAYMLQVTNKRIGESELSEDQIKAGDISGADGEPDGTINSGDLAKLLQYINGRIETLE